MILSKISRRALFYALFFTAILVVIKLVSEIILFNQTGNYNTAVRNSQFANAKEYRGNYGLFASAYAAQQKGDIQKALSGYAALEEVKEDSLQKDALFNAGNTYLQQALKLDPERDAEQVFPLVELAKVSYRKVLRIDAKYWDAKYNLERALQLLPDAVDAEVITQEGYARLVKAVISAANEDELP